MVVTLRLEITALFLSLHDGRLSRGSCLALKPLVSHLRYTSQVIPIRSQYLCQGNYRPNEGYSRQYNYTNSSRRQQHCCCSNNSRKATHRVAAAAAAALCMHIYFRIKLNYRLLRRHFNHHRTYFTLVRNTWRQPKKVKLVHKKKVPPEIRTTDPQMAQAATYLLPHYVSCIHRP